MKRTVTESQFIDAFDECNRGNNFSRDGRERLFEYLEECESGGEEIELDVIGLCCEFSEYESAVECAKEYGQVFADDPDMTPEENAEAHEAEAMKYLEDNTQVMEFDGGIIIVQF